MKGQYQISRANAFIKDEEYTVEFIDTPGYNKEDRTWFKPLKTLIIACYNLTYKHKREKKYKTFGDCEKAEYDYNV